MGGLEPGNDRIRWEPRLLFLPLTIGIQFFFLLPSCPQWPAQQTPKPIRAEDRPKQETHGVSSGSHFIIGARAALGGWNLGLLGPQQGSHLADLPLDTGSCSTAQGTVLFHAVAVVPHVTHVTGEQGAGGERRVRTDSACQPGAAQGQLPGWGWGWGRGRAHLMVCSSCSDSWLRATPLVSAMNTAFPEASWAWRNGI